MDRPRIRSRRRAFATAWWSGRVRCVLTRRWQHTRARAVPTKPGISHAALHRVNSIKHMRGSAPSKSLSGEAYSNVRQRILRGELKLGQVISRRTLASEMGMSFLPVSDALLRLEVEGLLESRPRAGTRVRIPTPQDVEGHYVVREALEMQAARLFAERATPEERTDLH